MGKKINIGIMGFGHIGRYIYKQSLNSTSFQVKAISDIGNIDSLLYLFKNDPRKEQFNVTASNNFFVYNEKKTSFINGACPGDVNWGELGVDWVIDATGKYLDKNILSKHIDSGAKKVVLASLPNNDLDNLIMPGINDSDINHSDEIISAGSSTTNAFALMLKVLNNYSDIKCSSLTTIHSYTSDQPLLDIAKPDLKRSRSAAKNIIPNANLSAKWIEKVLPDFQGKIFSTALNVPVQFGSLLDITTVFNNDIEDAEEINQVIERAANKMPSLIRVIKDPIVSSDVIGMTESIVFDRVGTLKINENMIKTLAWYDNGYNHAKRILDTILLYEDLR